jgi:hypothetical protein
VLTDAGKKSVQTVGRVLRTPRGGVERLSPHGKSRPVIRYTAPRRAAGALSFFERRRHGVAAP